MKKSFLIVTVTFLLALVLTSISLNAKISFAANPAPEATPTTDPSTSTSVAEQANPGPPIGIPCGKTMCLDNEVCVQYKGDVDMHCAPAVPTPSISGPTTPTPTPSGVITPTTAPIPAAPLPDKCPEGTGVFPPNGKCYSNIKSTPKDPNIYDKTCIYQPVVQYTDTRSYNTPNKQSFVQCGKGDSPFGPGPGGKDPNCDVALLVNTDVKQAELGSYGPSLPAEYVYSPDFLAQNYLYNSLFGRPMDFSNSGENNGEVPNREAYRTYWRLMPASNQANLRSFILNMANDNQIDNIFFDFTDTNGLQKKTDFKSLYKALEKQVILFWKFPFIRVGCLITYPVCPEYAQATRELKPVFQDLFDTALRLDLPLATPAIQAYNLAIAAFDKDLDGPYNAFVPLDFNSVRSYILKKPDVKENDAYKFFKYFEPLPRYKLYNVSFEHLPYVGAIYQGLLSPKFGMLPALQPQWVVDKYTTPDGLSDYRMGNKPEELPEVAIAHQGFIDQLEAEAKAIITSPLGWIADKISGIFSDEKTLKKGYITADKDKYTDDERIGEIREVYTNPVGCPLPLSYHVLAPKTAAKSVDDHHQVIIIPGQRLAWFYTPSCSNLGEKCSVVGGKTVCVPATCTGKGKYIEGDQCCEPAWSVEATEDAKAFDVLNNPKQADIREAVATNPEYSFYTMMLPDGKQSIPEASIDAPVAHHIAVKTLPNGKGEVLNEYEPINRISNGAQDSIHYLQNCWTVPGSLQNSPRCSLTIASASACAEPPVFTPDPSCKIKNNTLKLPDSLVKAIEAAATAFKVPPSLIIGLFYGEGAFNPGSKYLQEDFVSQNLAACTVIPGCNPSANSINSIVQYPSIWLKPYVDAVKVFDPARKPNLCNLLDGIFAMTKGIAQTQYGNPLFTGKTCFNIPLNNGSAKSSGTCSWDERNVETAIRVWELGTTYSEGNSCLTKAGSCLTGGGYAAQCPTGGDTCETKDRRYSQASHNGCVYDIYKEN